MDVIWKIFELSINFFESCIVVHFICAFLNHNFRSLQGKCIYSIGVLVDFICVSVMNSVVSYEGILGIIYVLEYLLFALVFLKGRFYQKFYVAIIAPLVMICANIIIANITSTAYKSELNIIYSEMSHQRITMIVLVQIVIICAYDLILKFRKVTLNHYEWKLVLSVLGVSFISRAFLHFALFNMKSYGQYTTMIVWAEYGVILINIVCFYMTFALSCSNSETERLKLQQQSDEYRAQYAENIRSQYEEMHRMRHDMKQNLAVISTLCNSRKFDDACDYANRVSQNLAIIDSFVDVKNTFINAILNSKLSYAKTCGIEVICISDSNLSGIDDIDLCNLLGNMLDNAIEAAIGIENALIDVSIKADCTKILVVVANTIEKSVLAENRELESTKKERTGHGYGVKTICSISNKYGGYADFSEEDNMFYAQSVLYKR